MRRRGFLRRMHRGGRIELVEPSKETMTSYTRKSRSFLSSALLLMDHERFEESISLTYYSMYYMVLALFSRIGLSCKNHTASIFLLREVFGIDDVALSAAKRERVDKQYYVDRHVSREEVGALLATAEEFIDMVIERLESLDEDKVRGYRERTARVLGT